MTSPTPATGASLVLGEPIVLDDAVPAIIVAITEDARLVVLDATTGEHVRTLLDRSARTDPNRDIPLEFPLEEVALSPDREYAYVTDVRRGKSGRHVITRVPVAGGEPETVVHGAAPSLSPDGRYLAFSFPADGNPQTNHNAIGVLDLESGERREWRLDSNEDDFFQTGGHIYTSEWSPDGSRIAYHLDYEGPETHVLEPDEDVSLSDAGYPGHPSAGYRASPSWAGANRLAAVEMCCYPEWNKQPGRAVIVDPVTGETYRALPSSGPVESVDAGAQKRFLLVLADGRLEIASRDGSSRQIASGIATAAW